MLDQIYRLLLHQHQQRWAKAVKEGGEIKYPHQFQPLTSDLVEAHIAGNITLGAMLLQPSAHNAKAGAIDIDCPRDAADLHSALALAKKIQQVGSDRGLYSYIEFSGNRGFHLWLFAAEPLPGATWIRALKNLAATAGFQAKEIFPNDPLKESKCIKLPGGLHLKSRRRCGFIPADPEWEAEGFPVLPEQGEVMADFVQNPPEVIAALAAAPGSREKVLPSKNPHSASNNPFVSFSNDEHPACIQHLIQTGAPLSLDYNAAKVMF